MAKFINMKVFRDSLDKVYLVYYTVIDASNEHCSKTYYYADIVFKNYNDAYNYVCEANNIPDSLREYHIECLPIL